MTVMPGYRRLVTYGCSLTKDNYIDTWADLLANYLNCPLVNLAERGAGYRYIVQKLISTDLNQDDLVCIMWPSADRLDLYVNSATPHLLKDLPNASWLDGNSASFVDYNGKYERDFGWFINGAVPRGHKHLYYKYFYNQTSHMNDAWASIVLTQNLLKNKSVHSIMCSSYPLTNLIQYHNDNVIDFNWKLYDAIDLSVFVKDVEHKGFIQLATEHNLEFFNPHYPSSNAHRWFLENYIVPEL